MKINDINRINKYIVIHGSKGKSDRIVPISNPTLRFIDQYLAKKVSNSELLFTDLKGNIMTERNIEGIVHRHVQNNYNMTRVTPHLFRHTYATRLYKRTKDPELVQQRMGHANYLTTKKYINLAN